jgi:hypothetical protein
MSAVLNIAGAALVLPNAGLALFFLAVGTLAEQKTLGGLLKAFWEFLGRLPDPAYLPFIALGVLVAIALAVAALIRFPVLMPVLIVAIGVASLVYVGSVAGTVALLTNPLAWGSVVGIVLAAWQLQRHLTATAPLPA